MKKREVQAKLIYSVVGGKPEAEIHYAGRWITDIGYFAKLISDDLGINEVGVYPIDIIATLGEERIAVERQICIEQMAQMICEAGGEQQFTKLFTKLCGGKVSPSKGVIQLRSHLSRSTYTWVKE